MKAGNWEIFDKVPFLDFKNEYIVVGYSDKDVCPYGTWHCINGDCQTGHYFMTKEEAVRDMLERAAL